MPDVIAVGFAGPEEISAYLGPLALKCTRDFLDFLLDLGQDSLSWDSWAVTDQLLALMNVTF